MSSLSWARNFDATVSAALTCEPRLNARWPDCLRCFRCNAACLASAAPKTATGDATFAEPPGEAGPAGVVMASTNFAGRTSLFRSTQDAVSVHLYKTSPA